ncbi:hypothetical protein [Endozoicomonas sp. 8E]|uniref:hypothetical protein n=1 Tax=Endozoicomonas sp. 8E TaxID=3035692 RepID=UPI0029390D2F|nr:hypothetical protein [Endozoicomonas sp. 8E]WOG25928.1 hypothetical protein P6910_15260 [Endozoicomonas sp. 8E]
MSAKTNYILFISLFWGVSSFMITHYVMDKIPVSFPINQNDFDSIFFIAPICTFLSSCLICHELISIDANKVVSSSCKSGAIVGLLSHLPTWFIFTLYNSFLGDTFEIQKFWFLYIGSTILIGWITVPYGLISGVLVASAYTGIKYPDHDE